MVPAAHAGVLTCWVADIPLPGSEKQPGRPVQPRAGGPRRSQNPRRPSLLHPDDGTRYYDHWVAALEKLIRAKRLLDADTLLNRKEAWARAYRATPHGKPVHLN